MRYHSSFIFFLLISLCCTTANAQVTEEAFNNYRGKAPVEKVYLHFDKFSYFRGEDIWFKAYVLNNMELTDSKNLYADVFDTTGTLIRHLSLPLFESTAAGQFNIPETYRGGFIHIKAYTQWMLNGEPQYFYSKTIPLARENMSVAGKASATRIGLFPEGGLLVSGFVNKVAFKATDENGNPVAVTGSLLGANGAVIDTIVTTHDGMGYFFVEPTGPEQYFFSVKDKQQQTISVPLPLAKNIGVHFEAVNTKDILRFRVERTQQATGQNKLLVVAQMNGRLVYTAKANLTQKTSVTGNINTSKFQPGVLQLTLLDSLLHPLAERVVFIRNKNGTTTPSVNIISKDLSKRGRNVIEVNIPDSIYANLSVAVTAAHLAADRYENILSALLLSGDVKGKVNDPLYYFTDTTEASEKALDLVMLTNGWRAYKVDEVMAATLPVFRYPVDTSYLFIKGRMTSKKMSTDLISYMLKTEKGNGKLFASIPDAQNNFRKDYIFFDSIKFIALDKKLAPDLSVQTNLLPAYTKNIKYTAGDLVTGEKRNLVFSISEAEQQRLNLLRTTTTLEDVIVKAKLKSKEQVLDERYTSGFFSGDAHYKFDIQSDPTALSAPDLLQYLIYYIPGLLVIPQQDQDVVAGVPQPPPGEPLVTWRNETPLFYLDENPAEQAEVLKVPMTQIGYIKAFPPPFLGAMSLAPSSGASTRGGAIAVYTKKVDYYSGADIISTILQGYSSFKQFYNPDYADTTTHIVNDNRTTIYWNPWLLIDPKQPKKTQIEFYNGDRYTKLKLIIQGVTADGRLVSYEQVLE